MPSDFHCHPGVPVRRGLTRRKGEPGLAGPPDHRPRAGLDLVPVEDDAHGLLHRLVGIQLEPSLAPHVSRRGGQSQDPAASLVLPRPLQTQSQPVELGFRHRALQFQEELVVLVVRIVDPLLVDHRHAGHAAERQEPPPVLRGTRQARDIERQHRAGLAVRDRPGQAGEPGPPVERRPTAGLVLVDNLDRLRGPAERDRPLSEVVLHHRRLVMVQHLRHGGLPHVDERPSGQLRGLDRASHRRPRFGRASRRPARDGPVCSTRGGPSPARWGPAAPSRGAASRFSLRASASAESSFPGGPPGVMRAATQAPSWRSASGANRTGRPSTTSAAGRGIRSVHATGRSLRRPSDCSTRSV